MSKIGPKVDVANLLPGSKEEKSVTLGRSAVELSRKRVAIELPRVGVSLLNNFYPEKRREEKLILLEALAVINYWTQ